MFFKAINCCDGIYDSSIDVRFTKMCDNNCSFCIEHQDGIDTLGTTQVKAMVDSVIRAAALEGKDTVLILGGEPFLKPKLLYSFVNGIRDFVEKIYITTSLPETVMASDYHIANIMTLIDGLNVSLHHYNWEKNNEILRARNRYNRVDNLEELAFYWGHKIRIQTNLVKGGLETAADVTRMVNMAMVIGVHEVKINELQGDVGDSYISFDDLFPDIKLGQPFSGGCTTDVSKHFLAGNLMKITAKRSCFLVQKKSPHGASFRDVLKLIDQRFSKYERKTSNVIYENGMQAENWLKKGSLIFRQKADS